jgi:hypothetical protein
MLTPTAGSSKRQERFSQANDEAQPIAPMSMKTASRRDVRRHAAERIYAATVPQVDLHPADDFRLGVDYPIDLDDPVDNCIHRGDVITFDQCDDVGHTEERVRAHHTRDLPQELHNPLGTGIPSVDKHVRLDLHAFGHLASVPRS